MRAARYHGREDVRVEDVPDPTPGPGEVLLRVAYNGLCGSDVAEYYHGPAATTTEPHTLTGVSNPCILGHELSGWVVGRGGGVDSVSDGQLVAVEPIETCRTCARCRTGHRHLCSRIAFHGYNRAGGGLAEFTVVTEDMIHPLPETISPLEGALIEPLAVAHRAVRRASVTEGDTVVVHGVGPIGLGAVIALRALGTRAIGVDTSATRRDAARRLGCELVLDPSCDDVASIVRDHTAGLGAAASIDAAGVAPALKAAINSTRPDGTIVIVAHHHEPLPLRSGHLIFGELRLTGSLIYDGTDFAAVIENMAEHRYSISDWTNVIDLDALVPGGFELLRSRSANKLVVRVGGDAPDA